MKGSFLDLSQMVQKYVGDGKKVTKGNVSKLL